MSNAVSEIYEKTLQLNVDEKSELLDQLLADIIAGTPAEIEEAQLQVAERRRREFLEGKVQGVPADEVFARARAKFKK